MEDAWEIDVLEMTLDDLEILQGFGGPEVSITEVKEALGRLVVNRTAEDIGKLTLKKLNEHLDAVLTRVDELAVPKVSDTPS